MKVITIVFGDTGAQDGAEYDDAIYLDGELRVISDFVKTPSLFTELEIPFALNHVKQGCQPYIYPDQLEKLELDSNCPCDQCIYFRQKNNSRV